MKRFLSIAIVLLLAVSCRQPSSQEHFIQGSGPYVFPVEMTDSAAVYDFDLFTRLDVDRPYDMHAIPAEMPVRVQWTSPSDSLFRETVYLPLSTDVYQPYRADVAPYEYGEWTLTITLPNPPEGLQGMGLVVKKKAWDTEN